MIPTDARKRLEEKGLSRSGPVESPQERPSSKPSREQLYAAAKRADPAWFDFFEQWERGGFSIDSAQATQSYHAAMHGELTRRLEKARILPPEVEVVARALGKHANGGLVDNWDTSNRYRQGHYVALARVAVKALRSFVLDAETERLKKALADIGVLSAAGGNNSGLIARRAREALSADSVIGPLEGPNAGNSGTNTETLSELDRLQGEEGE